MGQRPLAVSICQAALTITQVHAEWAHTLKLLCQGAENMLQKRTGGKGLLRKLKKALKIKSAIAILGGGG